MIGTKALVLAVLIVTLASQGALAKFNVDKIMKHFQSIKMKGADLEVGDNDEFGPKAAIRKFSFQNCGPASDPMKVKDLTVTPDPMSLPGNITFSGEATFGVNVTEPLTLSMKLIKVVGPIKIEIPCIDNFGSCTYQDVCKMLPSPNDCPAFFKEHEIPCNCPFPQGDYSGKGIEIEIDLPEKVPSGEYNIIADFNSKSLGHIGCVQIDLTVA